MRHALNGTHFSAAGSQFAVLHSECIRNQLRGKYETRCEVTFGMGQLMHFPQAPPIGHVSNHVAMSSHHNGCELAVKQSIR